ncbi:MAG: hypothetical protein ACI9IA_001053 [Enterobacterales bacterium]|jgi:hypothetical protein
MNIKHAVSLATLIGSLVSPIAINAAEPTNQELMDLIKKQQVQIEQLRLMVENNQKQVKKTDDKVEATVDAVESTMVAAKESKSKIGGYGELHYNNIEDDEQIDFHRFVMFFNHEFTNKIRFFSELEIEHALSGDGKPGEVELEQAYIEMDLNESNRLKTGVFLVPVGIINETHEPPTFYGVERNPVEKNIIPATWWEAGAGITSTIYEGLSADFAVHSGLNVETEGSNSYSIRNGRQKAAKANADSLAYTARLKYTAIPGVELAASYQVQSDVTQGINDSGASLITAHAIINSGKFGLKALYAKWDIDGSEAALLGRNEQNGYYIEPSFRLNDSWGFFARYNVWDNLAGNNTDTEITQTNFGINYWPHENVVFKFDFENQSGAGDGKGFNLGVGYMY